MAKRKAKKKSPSSSSRPPPSCPVRPPASGPSSPTKKQARHSSLPPQSRLLDFVLPSLKLTGPNWLPELCSAPISSELVASISASTLVAAGSATISQELVVSGATSSLVASGPLGVLQASESSPSFSSLFAPVDLSIAADFEDEDSSSCNYDSSSHYGSIDLAISGHPSSGLGGDSIEPSELEPLFAPPMLAAAMDSTPSLQAVFVSAQGHPPSDQVAAHGLNVPVPSDQVPALGSDAPAPLSPPSGQWRNLFSSNRSSASCPKLQHFVDISAAKTFNLVEDDIDIACDFWKLCLIGYVRANSRGLKL
ncbi:hypothetical protein OIU76_029988 [Salix suchowensis]|nr:hypothetical protein OIU76_029988 [Salix suchowensis]